MSGNPGADKAREHNITVVMRKSMQINGVEQVISFDECSVMLGTSCGELTVEGNALSVGALDVDRGYISLTGDITGINYSDGVVRRKKGLFGNRN